MADRSVLSLKTFLYGAIGIGAIVYYGQVGSHLVGQYYFGHSLPEYFHYSVIALISILTLTAIGCSVHLQSIGGFERGELARELEAGLAELRTIKALGENALLGVEAILPRHVHGLSTRGEEARRKLKQILHAVDIRLDKVTAITERGRLCDLCDGVDLLRRKLRNVESAKDALIDIDPFPAIPAHRLAQVVEGLVSELELGLRRAA